MTSEHITPMSETKLYRKVENQSIQAPPLIERGTRGNGGESLKANKYLPRAESDVEVTKNKNKKRNVRARKGEEEERRSERDNEKRESNLNVSIPLNFCLVLLPFFFSSRL